MSRQKETSPTSLFLIIAVVNVGNYLLNLLLGRLLGPEEFAEAGILATLVLVLSFVAIGLQLTTAKIVAQIKAESGAAEAAALLKWAMRKAIIAGCLVSLAVMLFAGGIKGFLQFERSAPILITAVGIPVYFLLSIQRGYLQGVQNFGLFSRSYVAEMVGRIIVTGIFVFLFMKGGLPWMTEAVALGFLASFASGCLASVPDSTIASRISPATNRLQKVIVRFLTIVMLYEFTQIIISYSDTILVRHYHDDYTTGLYTALSLIGRMVYFATWSVVMLLIPKVVELAASGQEHNRLFNRYFLFVCLGGAAVTLCCAAVPELIVQLLFGKAYLAIANVLWKYALATTLFAASNVFAYYYMSMDRYKPVLLSAIAGLAQILFITAGHGSIEYIINAQVLIMSILLTSMFLFHLLNKSSYEKTEVSYRYALSAE